MGLLHAVLQVAALDALDTLHVIAQPVRTHALWQAMVIVMTEGLDLSIQFARLEMTVLTAAASLRILIHRTSIRQGQHILIAHTLTRPLEAQHHPP